MAQRNYRPSVNILRDEAQELAYIPTPNAKRVVSQLVNDYKSGLRAFNIIGAYGTGKSSFLWALEQSLTKGKPYFEPHFLPNQKVDFIKLVGSYASIISSFTALLGIEEAEDLPEHILAELYHRYSKLSKKAPLLFIVVDEAGKFLEYAAKNLPEAELYFIQQLAEFANNTRFNIALITAVHQSFESYSYSLTSSQRQEWIKVKGRFKEIAFNEPVEQLLFLASEHIAERFSARATKTSLKDSVNLLVKSKAFADSEKYSITIAEKLFPLDLIAANVLTPALQRYGQNERSLFSFLEATDFTSLEKFDKSDSPFYGLPHVYDYLNFNLYSYLHSEFNPDYTSLANIRVAIEEIERAFEKNIESYVKLAKTIGLLGIFAAKGSLLDKTFFVGYAQKCLGLANAEQLIKDLEAAQIIFYRKHSKRYILFEGTEVDINEALRDAAKEHDDLGDIVGLLQKHIQFQPVLASQHSYLTGNARYFDYVFSTEPTTLAPKGEIDGFINLIFNEELTREQISSQSSTIPEAIVYAVYDNPSEIKSALNDIERTNKVLFAHHKDKIARRELENILSGQKRLLRQLVEGGLYSNAVTWYYHGQVIAVGNQRQLKEQLSAVCDEVYNEAPTYKMELINRHKLSGSIGAARRNYFQALTKNWSQPHLGFPADRFPPEKTIYLTLLEENGLSTFTDNGRTEVTVAQTSSFASLWQYCNDFLNQARHERKNLAELVTILRQRPLKLKQGLIDFWLPTFLFLKRYDFALFDEHRFIPDLTADTLELLAKNPEEYTIKAFDIEGIRLDIFNRYRIFLNKETKTSLSKSDFLETIKPFLSFYRGLSDYAKNTARLSTEAKSLREAIKKSQDPEQSFFEDFPAALNTSLSQLKESREDFEEYINTLQAAIRELRGSYDNLLGRFETFIQDEIVYRRVSFEEYKGLLQERYRLLKKHLLLPQQTSFVQRIDSGLEERGAWLSSVAQSLIERSLETARDEDEEKLYDRMKQMILDLDALTALSTEDVAEDQEEILSLQMDMFGVSAKRSIIRFPKAESKKIDAIKAGLKERLRKDKTLNIAAVAKLLEELMTS